MLDKLKVSMIQMQVTNQVEENVNKAIELIIEAGKSDPDVIILPENFHMMGRKDEFFETAETLDGPTLTRLRELAKELGTYIVAGTMRLRFPETEKLKIFAVSLILKEKYKICTIKYIPSMLKWVAEPIPEES